jgi:4'-phosphopantetheinyl transferase
MKQSDQVLIILDAQTASDDEVNVLASILPPYRTQKAGRYRKRSDRVNCITAFAMLAYLLKTNYDRDLPEKEILNAYGKPLLDPALWMSISHCNGAVCCCTSTGKVGVDAEDMVTRSADLAGTVLSAAEYAIWAEAGDRDRCFTEFWTQKEAYLKFLGTGLTDDLTSIGVEVRQDIFSFQTVWRGGICISTCSEYLLELQEMCIRDLIAWVRCEARIQNER